jgi:hypothetical protein
MRTHKTLAEILDEITTTALARQAKAKATEHESLDDEEYLDLEDILLAQYRAKRWLEENS